jgi:enoyl-CoA hydratase/carnithine racemase
MAEGASLTAAFARRGLIARHGSAWLLARLVGVQNAADLLYSGRKVACADAAQMGLIRALRDDGFLGQVVSLATALVVASSPRSLRVMRSQLHAGGQCSKRPCRPSARIDSPELDVDAEGPARWLPVVVACGVLGRFPGSNGATLLA